MAPKEARDTSTTFAHALLQQFVQPLRANSSVSPIVLAHHRSFEHTAFLPRQTWLVLPVRHHSHYVADVHPMRGLAEVVGRLSACASFSLRDFYHTFWKTALFDELQGGWVGIGDPAHTEYDSLEQLLAVKRSQSPRFMLDLSGETVTNAHVALLREFFTLDAAEVLGGENDALLSRLTADGSERAVARNRSAPVVEIGIMGSNCVIDSTTFRELCQLITDVQALQLRRQESWTHVSFDISTLQIENLRLSNSSDLALLTSVATNTNSTVRHLKLSDLIAYVDRQEVDIAAGFRDFIRATLYDKSRGDPSNALLSFAIPRALVTHHQFAELCSALRYSSQLKELSIGSLLSRYELRTSDSDSHLGVAWLAFAVFHPDSDIRLDRLDISKFPIKDRDMELVAEIITSVRPGRRLWELQHGSLPACELGFEEIDLPADQRVFVTLMPGDAKILSRPESESDVLFTAVDASEQFEVLMSLSSWVCVAVPGYGCGWASAAAVASQSAKPTKCVTTTSRLSTFSSASWPRAGPNVKHLERREQGGAMADASPFKHLLQMVGHSLVGLDSVVYTIEDDDVEEILDACPNLTYLNLEGTQLTDLSDIVDRYRSGRCKITSLNVASEGERNPILSQLAALLIEPCGEKLLHVCAGGAYDLFDANPEPFLALASALEVNTTLRFLRLSCGTLDQDFLKRLESNISEHRAIHRASSIAVAFLSVIAAKRSSSLGSLDATMLSHVLDFAGVPVTRLCTEY